MGGVGRWDELVRWVRVGRWGKGREAGGVM